MPLAPLAALAAIPIVADTVQILGYAGLIGGTIAGCYKSHKCKRGMEPEGFREVPRMNVTVAERQAEVGPCNVPMYNFDQCRDQLAGITVTGNFPSPGVAQFDNVPPACMDLVVVLSGSCTGEGTHPVTCGSACISYSGLTDVQLESLAYSLDVQK